MKRFIKSILMICLVVFFMTGIVFQMDSMFTLSVQAQSSTYGWEKTWDLNKCSTLSVNKKIFHGDSNYSIQLKNSAYNTSVATKAYKVKPNTTYKYTVWVKFPNGKVQASAYNKNAGATVLLGGTKAYVGDGYTGKKWKKIELEFTTGPDETSKKISLYNGYGSDAKGQCLCKGTAYFSDMSLEEVLPWDKGNEYQYDKTKKVSYQVDRKTVHGDADYSIKIKNNDFNVSYVTKTYQVEKNSQYRFTAWVKCSGYELLEGKPLDSGACISIAGNLANSLYGKASAKAVRSNSTKWKKLEFVFNTENETEYTVALFNGMFYSDAKGTVYFSDFSLEKKAQPATNQWNILMINYRDAKFPIINDDGNKDIWNKHIDDEAMAYIEATENRLYHSIPLLSEYKWGINAIDFVIPDETFTSISEIATETNGKTRYRYWFTDEKKFTDKIAAIVEKQEKLNDTQYDAVCIVAPLKEIGIFAGEKRSAILVNGHYVFCTYIAASNTGEWWDYPDNINLPEGVFVHELTHCAEDNSRNLHGYPTDRMDGLHNTDFYAGKMVEYNLGHKGTLLSEFMRDCLRNGATGICPEAYWVYNSNKWQIIEGKVQSSTNSSKVNVSNLIISAPKDSYTYTGKDIKPVITVKDVNTILNEGTDYVLSYYNNCNVGIAVVVVEGKGNYTGKFSMIFRILPKKPSVVNVSHNGNEYTVSWIPEAGVSGYDILYSTDGNKYMTVKTVEGGDVSYATVTLDSNVSYDFKIMPYTDLFPQRFYSE